MIGVALAFITLAIPIQFKTNWITIAWAIEGLVILWAGIEIKSARLRAVRTASLRWRAETRLLGHAVRLSRPIHAGAEQVLSVLVVRDGVFVCGRPRVSTNGRAQADRRQDLSTCDSYRSRSSRLWFIMSVETQTFFSARAARLKAAEEIHHQRWLGQMAMSVLWSAYASGLWQPVVSFVAQPAVRWAALCFLR